MGDREKHIDKAIEELRKNSSIKIKKISSIYETEPVGGVKQGKFLNGVLEIETGLEPKDLLKELLTVENRLGRKRTIKNGPRTIDLDILYYGDEVINEADLIVPHPRMMQREFVMRGLRELGKA